MLFSFGIKDAIDILLVAILLYQTYRLMKNTGVVNIFTGIIAFVVFWFLIVKVVKLEMTGAILNQIINVGAILLIVIFQNEIRSFFSRVGSRRNWRFVQRIEQYFRPKDSKNLTNQFPTMKLVLACRNLARTKTGALIVIKRFNSLNEYIKSGEELKASINTRLIENIFFKNSPLHDGAMIISDSKIVSAGAILPVSKKEDIPRHLGLRHRAAMGISEISDAIVIIVSEESGTITVAVDGAYKFNLTAEQLEREISELMNPQVN